MSYKGFSSKFTYVIAYVGSVGILIKDLFNLLRNKK